MSFWVDFSNIGDNHFLLCLLHLLVYPFGVVLCQFTHSLYCLNIVFLTFFHVFQLQSIIPLLLIKIQQHFLLQDILPIIDANRVIMLVQAMHKGSQRWFFNQPNIACGLPCLLVEQLHLGIYQPKSINHYFPFD